MKKTIGDLTLREITEMQCIDCSKCPFKPNGYSFTDLICYMVGVSANEILDQEIEVEDNEIHKN